jgi:hypothetical protein
VSSNLTNVQVLNHLLSTTWSPDTLPSSDAIPWQELLNTIKDSNLAGLFHFIVRQMQPSPPPDVIQVLEQEYYHTIIHNMRIFHQLAEVRKVMDSIGVPVLLIKGAASVETLYHHPAHRLIGDIDLVVPEAFVYTCHQVLIEKGYKQDKVDHQSGIPLIHKNEEVFSPPTPKFAQVELHWHLLDVPYYIKHLPMEWFWNNSQEQTIGGQSFLVLNPEANMVYLPAHLALHHQFKKIHSFYELALLIVQNKNNLDWSKVVKAASDFELLSVLQSTVERLQQTWPELPLEKLRYRSQNNHPTKNDRRLFRLLSADSRDHTLDFYTTLKLQPNFLSRLRYAWRNMFPQADYMMARYQIEYRWQLPFWYIYRVATGLPRLARILPHARELER